MKEKIVVVRDHRAGVFVGTLESFDLAAKTATLKDARKIHYWVGAAAVEGLAVCGCESGSRITPTVATVGLCDVVQIVECSEAGARKLLEFPTWEP